MLEDRGPCSAVPRPRPWPGPHLAPRPPPSLLPSPSLGPVAQRIERQASNLRAEARLLPGPSACRRLRAPHHTRDGFQIPHGCDAPEPRRSGHEPPARPRVWSLRRSRRPTVPSAGYPSRAVLRATVMQSMARTAGIGPQTTFSQRLGDAKLTIALIAVMQAKNQVPTGKGACRSRVPRSLREEARPTWRMSTRRRRSRSRSAGRSRVRRTGRPMQHGREVRPLRAPPGRSR